MSRSTRSTIVTSDEQLRTESYARGGSSCEGSVVDEWTSVLITLRHEVRRRVRSAVSERLRKERTRIEDPSERGKDMCAEHWGAKRRDVMHKFRMNEEKEKLKQRERELAGSKMGQQLDSLSGPLWSQFALELGPKSKKFYGRILRMIWHEELRWILAGDREQDHGIGCDSLFWALLVVFPLEGSHLLKKFSDGILGSHPKSFLHDPRIEELKIRWGLGFLKVPAAASWLARVRVGTARYGSINFYFSRIY